MLIHGYEFQKILKTWLENYINQYIMNFDRVQRNPEKRFFEILDYYLYCFLGETDHSFMVLYLELLKKNS